MYSTSCKKLEPEQQHRLGPHPIPLLSHPHCVFLFSNVLPGSSVSPGHLAGQCSVYVISHFPPPGFLQTACFALLYSVQTP